MIITLFGDRYRVKISWWNVYSFCGGLFTGWLIWAK